MTTIRCVGLLCAAACVATVAAEPLSAQAQPEILACYDAGSNSQGKPQGSGLVYRINAPGVVGQQGCVKPEHVQFSWTTQHGALTGLGADDHPQYLKRGESAGGDVAGTYAALTVVRLQNNPVADVDPTLAGEVLTWNGTAWAPAAPDGRATGTPDNVPGTLVQRDPTSGFRAGHVTLNQLTVTAGSLGTGKIDQTSNDGFVASGTFGVGAIPATGAGTRLMWYPAKAAFRAGLARGMEWDDANVGQSSTALGDHTIASGEASTALGSGAIASGSTATALGHATKATGDHSTALGQATIASGMQSTALGTNTTASGQTSTAMGFFASTNGQAGAFVYGDASTVNDVLASAPNQFVVRASGGFRFRTSPDLSTGCDVSAGALTCSSTIGSASGGFKFPDGTVQTTAAAGGATGTPNNVPNALVQRDAGGGFQAGSVTLDKLTVAGPTIIAGQVEVNSDGGLLVRGGPGGAIPATGRGDRLMWHPGKAAFRAGVTIDEWDDVNIGPASTAMGVQTTASGRASTAMGQGTTASGDLSVAMGFLTTANGGLATALGRSTTASGPLSTAIGENTTASGDASMTMGLFTTASGTASTAMGSFTTAPAFASLVIGQYNVAAGNPFNFFPTDPLFVAGNGSDNTNRANALTLLKNGNLTIAGTLTQSSDIRLKKEVEPLEPVLDRVRQLVPIHYRFREGTGHPDGRKLGLAAQAVAPLFPELVARGADGYLSIAYAELSTVLVRAIQEQQEQIEALRAELAALRAEMAHRSR